jgi:electron transport complex protein RnfB
MRIGLAREIKDGERRVALIDEPRCVGCTRCIDACPVDAIAGAQGFAHTVVAAWCTGCERCLPPCPVDCIAMVPAPAPWTKADAAAAARRARARKARLASESLPVLDRAQRRAAVAAALARRKRP